MLKLLALALASQLVACAVATPRRSSGSASQTQRDVITRMCLDGTGIPPECGFIIDEACARGAPGSCTRKAHVHATLAFWACAKDLRAMPAAPPEVCGHAEALLGESCRAGTREDCKEATTLASLRKSQAERAAAATCREESVATCDSLCESGDAEACAAMGGMYLSGQRVVRSAEKGTALLQVACDRDSVHACFELGFSLLATDPRAALAPLGKACDSVDRPFNEVACGALLTVFDRGSRVSPEERASRLQGLCQRETAGTLAKVGACGRLKDLGEAGPR